MHTPMVCYHENGQNLEEIEYFHQTRHGQSQAWTPFRVLEMRRCLLQTDCGFFLGLQLIYN